MTNKGNKGALAPFAFVAYSMSKIIYTGIESSGKSLMLSRKAEMVRLRNKRWYSITGLKRTMAFNSPMSKDFIDLIESSGSVYLFIKDLDDIIYLEEADIFIDEVIKWLRTRRIY